MNITENEQKAEATNQTETVKVIATAYYGPQPGQDEYATGSYQGDIDLNGNGITKTGKKAKVGYIAADWDLLPKGTEVKIPGYGKAVVEDIGSAIQGNRIDIFMGYGQEAMEKALKWGRKEIEIKVVKTAS